MEYEIAIDTGGTFTDIVVFSTDGSWTSAKVPTTPYDLSRCFFDALDASADALDVQRRELLAKTTRIVYATTLGTNTLLQRRGPRVGLLTTAGAQDTLHLMRGVGPRDHGDSGNGEVSTGFTKPEPLVPRDLVLGVTERVASDGKIVVPLDGAEVREALQRLLDMGVDGIAVCLLNSYVNPTHEQLVRDIARAEYPSHFVGSVPVFVSSDIAPYRGEYGRANTTVVDAYLHRPLARFLYPLEEAIRREGYVGHPLLILGNDGTASRVAKTTAARTWNSGPVAGVMGGLSLSRVVGLQNLVLVDMGGTSFDISIIEGTSLSLEKEPILEGGLRLSLPVVRTIAIGSGGGTIARVDPQTKSLTVGPESAEAIPGPASFGLGGNLPTVTDADVVLGLVDPDRFLGGKFRLSVDAAVAAIEEHIAQPLEMDVYSAASEIRHAIQRQMALRLRRELSYRRVRVDETTLLAFGGAGPTHVCGIARQIGCNRILITTYSSVFSAVGASLRPVEHIYSHDLRLPLHEVAPEDASSLNVSVADLFREAERDMRIEGFATEDVSFDCQIEVISSPINHRTWFEVPVGRSGLDHQDFDVIGHVRKKFEEELVDLGALPSDPSRRAEWLAKVLDKLSVAAIQVRAVAGSPRPSVDARRQISTAPSFPEKRPVWMKGSFVDVPVRSILSIAPDESLDGPAIIELPDSTCVVDETFTVHVDRDTNCWLEAR